MLVFDIHYLDIGGISVDIASERLHSKGSGHPFAYLVEPARFPIPVLPTM